MSLNIASGKKVRAVGDSLVLGVTMGNIGWMEAPGGLRDQMLAVRPTPPAQNISASKTSANVTVSKIAGGTVTVGPITTTALSLYSSKGVGGAAASNWRTDFYLYLGTDVVDVLVAAFAVNDLISAVSVPQHAIDYAFCVDLARTTFPNIQVLCVGALVWDERWNPGSPATLLGGVSTSVYDTNIQTICAARPGWTEYCPLAPSVLAYEQANNATPVGPPNGVSLGKLTNDGLHPNATGQIWLPNRIMEHFTFSG